MRTSLGGVDGMGEAGDFMFERVDDVEGEFVHVLFGEFKFFEFVFVAGLVAEQVVAFVLSEAVPAQQGGEEGEEEGEEGALHGLRVFEFGLGFGL